MARALREDQAAVAAVAATAGDTATTADPDHSIGRSLVSWLAATVMAYCILFGTGKLLLGRPAVGVALLAAAAASFAVLYVSMRGARREEERASASSSPPVPVTAHSPAEVA